MNVGHLDPIASSSRRALLEQTAWLTLPALWKQAPGGAISALCQAGSSSSSPPPPPSSSCTKATKDTSRGGKTHFSRSASYWLVVVKYHPLHFPEEETGSRR